MENSFQTSFIPKKPITEAPVKATGGGSVNFFTVIAVFILIVAGGVSGGLYLYKNILVSQKASLSASLLKGRDNFEKDTIDELELFDKRASAAKDVLSSHLVLSPMFDLLGSLTIPSIQYTKFEHNTTDSGFSVKITGVASDYKSIALQADVFNGAKGRFFKNVVFSNLIKDKSGSVVFTCEFIVDPALLSYERNVLLQQATALPTTLNNTQ